MARLLSVVIYGIVGAGLMVQGIRYLFASEFERYHAAVVATPWSELTSKQQTLILGLMKGFGAGLFSVGLAVMLLAVVSLRADGAWARWIACVISISYTGALIYATRFALLPGASPITVAMTLCLLSIAAAVASFLPLEPFR
jgi:hypothetical protein